MLQVPHENLDRKGDADLGLLAWLLARISVAQTLGVHLMRQAILEEPGSRAAPPRNRGEWRPDRAEEDALATPFPVVSLDVV
jgi:hypothetical protein